MPFPAPTPTNVPAQPAVVYDQYWMKQFQIMSNDPTGKIRVMAILHKARDIGGGVYELSPVDSDVVVVVPDVVALNDSNVATLRTAILAEVSAIAVAQHLI